MFKLLSNPDDPRGTIEEIVKDSDVLRIKSKKGSRRAGHYHKSSGHWCLVTKGSISYFWRAVDEFIPPRKRIFREGEIFYTPPLEEHLMLFEEYTDNEFYCFSTGDRNPDAYEDDLVRLTINLDEVGYIPVDHCE